MDKIVALVPTANNQIIAVPIKTLTSGCTNKIQLTTATTKSNTTVAHSIIPQVNLNTNTSSSTITIPSSIKSIAGLKTLPSGLKITNNVLSIQKTDPLSSSTSDGREVKPTASYLICSSKNSLINDLSISKVDESSSNKKTDLTKQSTNSFVTHLQPTINRQQLTTTQPLLTLITTAAPISTSTTASVKPIRLNCNQLIEQTSGHTLISDCSSVSPTISTKVHATSSETEEKMEVDVQGKQKFMSQLESISEENESNQNQHKDKSVIVVCHELISNVSNQAQDENNTTSQTSNNQMIENDNEFSENEIEMLSSPESDFDPVDALVWTNDVGVLPGTNLQFKLNEYDCLELLTNEEADEIRQNFVPTSNHLSYANDHHQKLYLSNGTMSSEDLYSVCSTCGEKKLKANFIRKGRFCSQDCASYQSSQLRNFKKSNLFNDHSMDKMIHADHDSAVSLIDFKNQQNLQNKQSKSRQTESLESFDQHRNVHYSGWEDSLHSQNLDNLRTRVRENYRDKYFSWKNYLFQTRSIAAPLKCFKQNQLFNDRVNYFKVGMKLEAIDPLHPSLFCVASVAEVIGQRIRVHLDKYSSMFDFWVNCDSPFIFSVGFCAKTNRQLQPPKNYENFDWSTYLHQEKAKAAPKHCFYWNNKQVTHHPPGFKIGAKLEAVDKANSSLVCVATIVDMLGEWLLIHFDGWDNDYDYWTDYTSPYIHPTNWCKAKGKALTPPKDYPKSSFNWQDYLEESRSICVPSSAFRVRPVNTFKTFMKLEVVDRKNPRYIRVATIIARGSYSIKLSLDNFDEKYDFYADDDSPDIHPVNWCAQNNCYIEEPPPYDYDPMSYYNRCQIFGCKSFGHLRNPNLMDHVSIEDCPYAPENLDYEVPDRFGDSSELSSENFSINDDDQSNLIMSNAPSPNSDSMSLSTSNDKTNYCSTAKFAKEKRNMYNSYSLECFDMYNSDSEHLSRSSSPNSDYLNMLPIRQSIIDLKTSFLRLEEPLLHWDKNTRHLIDYVSSLKAEEVLEWTCDRVAQFVNMIPGCEEYVDKFKEQSIDGESLLLLTQNDLIKILGIKLGPGIKLYNSILILRQNISSTLCSLPKQD